MTISMMTAAAAAPTHRLRTTGLFGLEPPGGERRVRVRKQVRTDVPFQEIKSLPMREYLAQDAHIFQSLFPDQSRAGELSKGVYRVQLLERQFLMWKVKPVVTLNIRTALDEDQDALPESTCVYLGVSDIVLQGVEDIISSKDFQLEVDGKLVCREKPQKSASPGSARNGSQLLRGKLSVTTTFKVPELLSFTPTQIIETAGDAILDSIVTQMDNQYAILVQVKRNLVRHYYRVAAKTKSSALR